MFKRKSILNEILSLNLPCRRQISKENKYLTDRLREIPDDYFAPFHKNIALPDQIIAFNRCIKDANDEAITLNDEAITANHAPSASNGRVIECNCFVIECNCLVIECNCLAIERKNFV